MNSHGFKLSNGTRVKLYNEKDSMSKRRSIIQPGEYHIKKFKNGLYHVVEYDMNSDKNKIHKIPRYKLSPIY